MIRGTITILAAMAALLLAPAALAQEFPLYRTLPGGREHPLQAEIYEQWPSTDLHFIRNVTRPTITAVLPDPAKATGAGVLVLPGGGFVALSIDNEGLKAARWFADRGIAAFVLKYRLDPTPPDQKAMFQQLQAVDAHIAADPEAPLSGEPAAREDARDAFTLLRRRAAEFGVDPARLGVIGFSAGGFLAIDLATGRAPRPAFIAALYAPVRHGVHVPEGAPPLFTAMAADDRLFGPLASQSYEMWRAAHAPAELHIYETGGHGFGMSHLGTASDAWTEDLQRWLTLYGWTRRP